MREGFEPNELKPASSRESAVEDDDGEQTRDNHMPEEMDDARRWSEGSEDPRGKSSKRPKSPLGSLKDRSVWDGTGESY